MFATHARPTRSVRAAAAAAAPLRRWRRSTAVATPLPVAASLVVASITRPSYTLPPSPHHLHSHLLSRYFSSKSPKRRVELHPHQQAVHAANVSELMRANPDIATVDPDSIRVDDRFEPGQGTEGKKDERPPNVTINVASKLVSTTPLSGRQFATPDAIDAQGRHILRTKTHPEGAIVGRGRVVANFGTRMLVQELPWNMKSDVSSGGEEVVELKLSDATSTTTETTDTDAATTSHQHPTSTSTPPRPGPSNRIPSPPGTAPHAALPTATYSTTANPVGANVEGTRFIAVPRGKIGKVVCGDIVLWEWNVNNTDSDAFIVDVLPRTTALVRAESQYITQSSGHGQKERGHTQHKHTSTPLGSVEEVLLASNFHHVAIICAAQPAPNWTLIDRYVAAATRMRVTASIVFNKTDLPVTKEIEQHLNDYEVLGIPVFRTCTVEGQQRGLSELRRHLATVGPNGTPGITIFLGQSGCGKTSLLNALSPSLQLAVNELSRNEQGRHTTTQTILHQLEDNGGEIIDSPGFQNYLPPPLSLQHAHDVAAGFPEIIQAAKYCRYAHKCRHVNEPMCAVKLAVRTTDEDKREAARLLTHVNEDLSPAPSSPQEAAVRAFQRADARAIAEGVESFEELLSEAHTSSTPSRQRRRENEVTRRQKRQQLDNMLVAQEMVKLRALQLEAAGKDLEHMSQEQLRQLSATEEEDKLAYTRQDLRAMTIAQKLHRDGLLDTISKRRYQSYVDLVEQQVEMEKNRW